jgi:AcrR family transcriptional regulator
VVVTYGGLVPKLWNDTIEAHRQQVRDTVLDSAAALVAEHGLRAVTMSQIAEQAGIGRATLYKYFSDVDAVLHAWHHREITRHLHQLAEVRDHADTPGRRLHDVLHAYALISHHTHGHHDADLVAFLHQDEHVIHAQQQLHTLVRELIADAARTGDLRADIAPDELATYCLHALTAARDLPSTAAVQRLVDLALIGLQPTGA